MTSSRSSLAKYLLLVGVMLVMFWAQDDVKVVKAAPLRATARIQPVVQPVVQPEPVVLTASIREREYLSLPEEDLNPIEWVNPPRIWARQMGRIAQWKPIVDAVLEDNDYQVDYMTILGIIAQESQGDNDAECNEFDTQRNQCAVGLMALAPGNCGLTASQLKNPAMNIDCGTRIINEVYGQAIEHGFRPGYEATRAALAAYNCSWESLLANRCYFFGGWTYADKINNYWLLHLTNYLQGVKK